MLVQSSSEKNLRNDKFNKNIANFIVRFQSILNISDEEILDVLELNKKEFTKVIHGKTNLDILKLCNLSNIYNFDLDALFDNSIDFEVLRQHHIGNCNCISEKYLIGAHSKKRLLITIFDYIEKNYGWAIKEAILNHFQLTKSIYSDPDGAINVYLFEDVLSFIFKYGLTKKDIYSIGHYSLLTTNAVMTRELSSSKKPKDMYEKYFTEFIPFIEHNNSYKITSLTDYSCEVESREINNNLDLFKVKHIGGPLRCAYRLGALQAATQYLGLPFSQVSEIQCAHKGDDVCKYLIKYEFPKFYLNHRGKQTRMPQTWKMQ
ncbi:MAG: hypothetical protein PHY93_17830 [Bacteriovorax sp.]|nr:hypothetical protein [Bacteriovorax sp.]